MGRASSIESVHPATQPRGSAEPIENSPPGIQTMPGGGSPAGAPALGRVAANADETSRDAASFSGRVERRTIAATRTAAPPTRIAAATPQARPLILLGRASLAR